MLQAIGRIFGSSEIVSKGLDLIDDAFTSEIELLEAKTEAQVKMLTAKTEAKAKLLDSYSGYKVAQRYLSFLFCIPFVFIIVAGMASLMFGLGDIEAVKQAALFANELWLGQIVAIIISFYFGGGLVESVKRKLK